MEFLWPDKTAVLIYDGSKTTVGDVIAYIKASKKRELSVITDRPFP